VHFYAHRRTGAIDYGYDYQVTAAARELENIRELDYQRAYVSSMSGRSDAAESRRSNDGPGRFEAFVEQVHRVVSSATFFFVVVVVLVVWTASLPLWSSATKWELALHTGSSVVSLLLLALLQNAGRRSEEASHEKLNVIAEALSDLMASRARDDEELGESVRKLRQAVGLEERH